MLEQMQNILSPPTGRKCCRKCIWKPILKKKILLYQQPNGGWPKNYDMLAILSDDQKKRLADHKDADRTTFDNGSTYAQIEYLAKAYTLAGNNQYKDAALRGIHFILQAQYGN